ncbi:MAG: MoxR family ATPase [Myxococcota bacterium]
MRNPKLRPRKKRLRFGTCPTPIVKEEQRSMRQEPNLKNSISRIEDIKAEIAKVIRGKTQAIERVCTTLLANGHLLLEDVPGVGKTTLAHTTAIVTGCPFRRIQFTADMLPSDLLGLSIFNQNNQDFDFRPGPIFSSIILADEINRASPRTQSALLEAMNDGQVTIDRVTHPLPQPFLVIATQNPLESYGTYPLPDSQLDRFLMRIPLGYPPPEIEKQVLRNRTQISPLEQLQSVTQPDDILSLQKQIEHIRFEDTLQNYLFEIVHETRQSKLISIGVSTRGALLFHRAVRAHALVQGRKYVIPEDIKSLVLPCLAHRIVLTQNQGTWSPNHTRDSEQIHNYNHQRLSVPL